MKRILLTVTAVCAAFTMNAQVDTLTEFFTGTPTIYTGGPGNGYVSGNNVYDDKGKYMRFDSQTGITGNGMVTGCLVWVALKNDAGGSFSVDVIDHTGGVPGATLASETVTVAAADTSLAGFMVAEGAVGYNVAVTFSSPVAITAASDLLIGVTLPTTDDAGDTIVVVSNSIGDFALATTHSWELASDDSWFDMSTNWGGFDAALAIFPTVDMVGGVTESSIEAKVYPNPASTVLNIETTGFANTVSILSMDGKVISTTTMNGTTGSVNVADLTEGVYFYEVVSEDGSVVRDTFVKK